MNKLLCLFLLLSTPLMGQDKAAFYANASSLKVMEGGVFRVQFIMNNIKGANFKAPVFDHFEVLSGPNQTSSYSNNNGRVTQQYIYSYDLQASKVGRFTIKAAYCDYNGQKLATTPFEINVVERDEKSLEALGLPSDKDLFVRMETPYDTAYMGERVEIVYKLYARKDVRSYDIKNESDYLGFFVRPLPSRNKEATQEIINGETYSTQILEKRMLYPQQTGTFSIESARINLGLQDPTRRNTGFFFNSSLKQFPVQTNALTLHVVELPSGAPESFSGAVGKFQMQATIDKNKLSTDDAITLTLTVVGNGDAKYILPSKQSHLTDFEIYDPNIIEKGEREMFGDLQTIKSFEYLVVPLKAGRQSLQAHFTYFDTDKRQYITLKSQIFPLMVEQGSSLSAVRIEKSEDSDRTLSGIMPKLKLKTKVKSHFGGPVHLSLLAMSLLGIGWIFYKKRLLEIEKGIDPFTKKRRKAQSIAEKRLSKAQEYLEAGDHRSFYEEISRSILGFIADKLNVPNSEISKSSVAFRLRNEQVTEEKIQSIIQILSQAEVAVFAGKKDGDLQSVYKRSKDLISYLSEKI